MKKPITSNNASRLRPVQSRQNATIKALRKAFSAGDLTDKGCCAVESFKLVTEAIKSGLEFEAIVFSESVIDLRATKELLEQVPSDVEALVVPDDVFKSAVDTESPQGVAALVFPREYKLQDLTKPAFLVVVAAGIQDPGNLGTIIRSAEAFGASGVIVGENTVSRVNPKALRASAGSLFRVPCVASNLSSAMTELRHNKFRLIGTSSHEGVRLDQARLTGSIALFIGSEGSGLPQSIVKQMDELVTIPHSPQLESLNAGVAASILLYEAARQRNKAGALA